MGRINPIRLTLIDKEIKTDDEGNTFYEYHYSYVGKGGETRYKTVKRSYVSKRVSDKKSGRNIDAGKMFKSKEQTDSDDISSDF